MGNKICESQRNILVIANPSLKSTRKFLNQLYQSLQQHPNYRCYSLGYHEEGHTKVISEKDTLVLSEIQLVFVVGQNRDLLKAFSLFSSRDCPPVFGIGNSNDHTSPSLFNYSFYHAEIISSLIFNQPNWGNLANDRLMKLSLAIDCMKVGEATSQIQVHRGMNKMVAVLNIYIQNSCEQQTIKIGQFRGDGLLISTPFGSFGKSLSFNGPLMDRTMENIMITPICPLSMKFRPLCLPAKTTMFIQIDKQARTDEVDVYIDENVKHVQLRKGEFLRIRMSKFKTQVISNTIQSSEEFFIRSLKSMLKWGQTYEHIEIEKAKLLKRVSTLNLNQEFDAKEKSS